MQEKDIQNVQNLLTDQNSIQLKMVFNLLLTQQKQNLTNQSNFTSNSVLTEETQTNKFVALLFSLTEQERA